MFGKLSAWVLLALNTQVFGQAATYSKSACFTNYGSKSVHSVPRSTTTRATTITAYRKKVVYPTRTITPKPVTKGTWTNAYNTKTSTLLQETDTYSTLVVIETTETLFTSTTTTQTTESVTTFSTGGTLTVTTSAGYTPIQSVAGNPPSRKKRDVLHERRTPVSEPLETLEERGKFRQLCGMDHGKPYIPGRYPKNVACERKIKVFTTAYSTSTCGRTITKVAEPLTVLTTRTITHRRHALETPVRASTTLISSMTITYSTLSTLTYAETASILSSTTVEAVPTATTYPAGDDRANYISSVNGRPITILRGSDLDIKDTILISTSDAKECCQRCFDSSTDCLGSAFAFGSCVLVLATVCSPTLVLVRYDAQTFDTGPGYTLSNGNCGRIQWDGNV